ncbi:MAG: acetyl-CoA carboxylase biotin carboxyl carrier protein subunit, partial [bacterium]
DEGVPAGWRNVASVPELTPLREMGAESDITVTTLWGRDGIRIGVLADGAEPFVDEPRDLGPASVRATGGGVAVRIDGVLTNCAVSSYDDLVCVDDELWSTQWHRVSPYPDSSGDAGARGPSTPVPGTVTVVEVAVGDRVAAGQTLVVIEAMKMEHRITADIDGVVAEVLVVQGQSVEAHAVVAVLETGETT